MSERSTGSTRRKAFLKQTEGLVCGIRQHAYGDAEDNFQDIAMILSILLKGKLKERLTAIDVGYIMIATKLARTIRSPENLDHPLDIAGYAACVGGILMGSHEPPAIAAPRPDPSQPEHPDAG